MRCVARTPRSVRLQAPLAVASVLSAPMLATTEALARGAGRIRMQTVVRRYQRTIGP